MCFFSIVVSFIRVFPYRGSIRFFIQVTCGLCSLSIFMCGLQPIAARSVSVLQKERGN